MPTNQLYQTDQNWPLKDEAEYLSLLEAYLTCDGSPLIINIDNIQFVAKFNPKLAFVTKSILNQQKELTFQTLQQSISNPKSTDRNAIRTEQLALELCAMLSKEISQLKVCRFQVQPATFLDKEDEMRPWFDIGLSEYDKHFIALGESLSKDHDATTWKDAIFTLSVETWPQLSRGERFCTSIATQASSSAALTTLHQTLSRQARVDLPLNHHFWLFGWTLLCQDADVIGPKELQNVGLSTQAEKTVGCKIDAGLADFFSLQYIPIVR